jgi:hypothetical protein
MVAFGGDSSQSLTKVPGQLRKMSHISRADRELYCIYARKKEKCAKKYYINTI